MSSNNGVVVRADRLPTFRTIEEWGAGLKWLVQDWRDRKWRVAEYLVRGDDRFKDLIWQYVDPRELKMKTDQEVRNAIWTYRQIGDQYTAEANLSFDMWRELASLKPEQRDPFITRALRDEPIHRDEIRALAASKNGSKVNGAGNGSDGSNGLPSAKDAAFEALAEAIKQVAYLFRRKAEEEEWRDALDVLAERAVALRAKLGA